MNSNDDRPQSPDNLSVDSAKAFHRQAVETQQLKTMIQVFKTEFPFLVIKIKE